MFGTRWRESGLQILDSGSRAVMPGPESAVRIMQMFYCNVTPWIVG